MTIRDDLGFEYSVLNSDESLGYSHNQNETHLANDTNDVNDVNDGNDFNDSNDSNDDNLIDSYEPQDRLRLVQITFGVIGLSQLLPWNFFITANDYWMFKFRDINHTSDDSLENYKLLSSEKTTLQTYFDSYLSIANNLPFLVILLLNAFYGQKIREEVRNVSSFCVVIVIFTITTAFVKINTDNYQQTFFGLTIALVVLLSSSAAFLQASVSGIAAVFPSECMHFMVSGQAVSGLFAAFAQILSIAGQWKVEESAFYYFLLADITLILALLMYLLIHKTDYYNYHKRKVNQSRRQLDSFPVNPQQRSNTLKILYFIWPHTMAVMLVFWVSLALFPSITVLVIPRKPNSSEWTGKYFLPITCFLLFNLSDFTGRFVGQLCPIPLKRKFLLLSLSISRVVLIPLIMLCNATPRSHLPILFKSEVYFILFITLLGFSNGYILINAMISGPLFVPEEYRENAGFFLVAFLGLGLTLGSFSSNILLRIL